MNEKNKGKMTVEEAGRMSGLKTSETHGLEFYSAIGSKGGQRVRRLIREEKSTKRNERYFGVFFT